MQPFAVLQQESCYFLLSDLFTAIIVRRRIHMRRLLPLLGLVLLLGCQKNDGEKERIETLENRVQATEFQMATLAEMEPRVINQIRLVEEKTQEWANLVDSSRERISDSEARSLNLEQRLEQVESWIREKEKEEEKTFATPDGETPDAWKELAEKCKVTMAGEAQTTLNFLVRVDRYMSEFPVHHPVELDEEDPLVCMTSNLARDSVPLRNAYRDRELTILKSRDQWLGYRVDRSWDRRPERGECSISCCELDLEGNWNCSWGFEGGRWECEYDIEGWRNYKRRWHRKCDYLEGTRDFYTKPYLMQKMEEREFATPEKLYCTVDLVWENRIYCLSHGQYPVMQIRLPEDPMQPRPRPLLPRFTVISVVNWDVLYKDEWTSTWIVTGVNQPEFAGQVSGMTIGIVGEPECCVSHNPEGVLAIETALMCLPEPHREQALPALVQKHGFRSTLDYETERMAIMATAAGQQRLQSVREAGCPNEQP